MARLFLSIFLGSSFLLSGCALTQKTGWGAESGPAKADIGPVTAQIDPICNNFGCTGFTLTVQNNSDRDIEIDWNKTLYIEGSQTNGGFIFEGIVFRDRNNMKSPDFVFANGTLKKEVYPNVFVNFEVGTYFSQWKHHILPAGNNGVYLSLNDTGTEHRGRLAVNLVQSAEFFNAVAAQKVNRMMRVGP